MMPGLDLYFEQGGVHITRVLNGQDNPDDAAQAWLDGDMERYERLLSELPKSSFQDKPKRRRGRPASDAVAEIRDLALELRARDLSFAEIASIVKVSRSTVWRICKRNLA